jgi:FkbM family methyltransferase
MFEPFLAKGRKLAVIFSHTDYLQALRFGVAAAVEHRSVLQGLQCQTVVDIGANRGQFALVARNCFPEATIISFEPLPGPAAQFRAVFAGDPRVTLHQAAVGPQCGQAMIHISRRDDSSSLLPITSMQDTLFPGTAEIATETVRVAPLNEFVSEADVGPQALLKLDVQGYELMALKGCETLIDRFAFVYVECSFVELYEGQALANEVIGYLHARPWGLQGIYNVRYSAAGRAIQADFLFASV